MSNFRLNAKKPHKNAGLPTPKSEIYLLYVEDIISMPQSNPKGVVTEGNILIADGRRFHILYLTPSTQTHNRDTEGDVDSRGWKKKIVGHYPGDEIEINEFIKNNTNQGFVIVVKSCGSNYKKIYGSKCNPLFFTGAFIDDSEKKGYDLTFEQEFADADPVLFYDGNILVDEDALDPNDPEFSTLFVKIDGSNISGANKEKLKQALDIGELPSNIALVDEGDDEGNTYTKLQADDKFLKKTTTTIPAPTSDFKYVYLANEANETRRMLAGDLGKNVANAALTSVEGAGLTQGANWTHNTAGFHYYLKGLPDKANDADFDKILVQNSSGQVGTGNGKAIIQNMPNFLNDSEKTAWKTAMNGGWTTKTMSVIMINPSVIDKSDKATYVTVYGANLNLNPNNFKIQILSSNSNGSTKTVIADIPNANVILSSSSDLTFWFNFKNIPAGTYKLSINNGVAEIITDVTFDIVAQLTPVNFSDNVWEVKTFNGNNNNQNHTVQNSAFQFSCQNIPEILPLANDGKIALAATSIPFATMADNFVIEISGWISVHNAGMKDYIGISNDKTPNASNSILTGMMLSIASFTNLITNTAHTGSYTSGNRLVIQKKGNFLSVLVKATSAWAPYATTVSVGSMQCSNDPLLPVRLKHVIGNCASGTAVHNLQIITMYKY